ncbi:MAG: SdrD B-like domain-containing protein [Bacteroidia bacterium]
MWKDIDGDGQVDAGEPGIAGVVLSLQMWDAGTSSYAPATDINGAAVPNQTTDGSGNYRFENLPDSIYRVVMIGDNWTTRCFLNEWYLCRLCRHHDDKS